MAQTAKQRSQREEADGRGKDPSRAEPIRHPAADGNEDREAQCVAGQHRLHAQRGHRQGLRDRRDGRVEDRGVERLHEERHRDQPREQALNDAGWRRNRRRRPGVVRVHLKRGSGEPRRRLWQFVSFREATFTIARSQDTCVRAGLTTLDTRGLNVPRPER